jgi:hypothetical protein
MEFSEPTCSRVRVDAKLSRNLCGSPRTSGAKEEQENLELLDGVEISSDEMLDLRWQGCIRHVIERSGVRAVSGW